MEGATRALQSGVPDNHKGCLDVWNFYLGVRVFFFFFSIYMSQLSETLQAVVRRLFIGSRWVLDRASR